MRRTRILVVHPEKADGTSYYRAWNPLSRLSNVELVEPKKDVLSWATLADIDIVFYQRPCTQFDVVQLDLVKSCRKPIWVDFDDNGFSVPEDNLAHNFYIRDDKQACMRAIIKLADIITVSTPALKEALQEQVPTANITIIPNAVDDNLFVVEPLIHQREKVILMRGASGHKNDWGMYKDTILDILRDYPEYKLAVCGFHPEWLSEVPDSQLRLYQFSSIPEYFETLMQIRPEIMIVPLIDNDFNKSKSAIALFEGVLAGAAVTAASLPEFNKYRSLPFSNPIELYDNVRTFIDCPQVREYYYVNQVNILPRLSYVNELRKDVIEYLCKLDKKIKPINLKSDPATDKEFYEYALSRGHTQDNPVYAKGHKSAAEWIINNINPRTVVEYGSGPGATLTELLKSGVMAYGLEINPYLVNYFKENYPMYESQVTLCDFTKEPIEVDSPCDLGISIEVLEHIDMPEEWWNQFITDLAKKYRKFYFSSTPFYTTAYFDRYWGHCNIRKASSWVKLFTSNGWKYEGNPKVMTSWDLLFSSKFLA
jgi:hypothetical protein